MQPRQRGTMSQSLRRPAIPTVHRATVALLGLVLLVTGCATVPAGPGAGEPQRTAEQLAADRAGCEASARQAEDSRVLRAALGSGLLAGGLVMIYGAGEGASWGAISGGSRAEGAWIGAAMGAGVGLIIGTVAGVAKAREALGRYESAYAACLSERAPPAAPATPDGGAA